MEKETTISLIKARIESEYRKHKDLDWAEIAARKIYSEAIVRNKVENLTEDAVAVLDMVQDVFDESEECNLEIECIGFAFIALKNDPSLSIGEALTIGLGEWIK